MNQDLFGTAYSLHIGNIIDSLSKRDTSRSVKDIEEIVCAFGPSAEHTVFRTILQKFEWVSTTSKSISSTVKVFTSEKDGVCLVCRETTLGSISAFLSGYSLSVPPARFIATFGLALLQSSVVSKFGLVRLRQQQGNNSTASFGGPFTVLFRYAFKLSALQEACLLLYLFRRVSVPEHRSELGNLVSSRLPVLLVSIPAHSSSRSGETSDFSDNWVECLHELLIGLLEGCSLPINKSPLPDLGVTSYTLPQTHLSHLSSSLLPSSIGFTQGSAGGVSFPVGAGTGVSASSLFSVGPGLCSVIVSSEAFKTFVKHLQAYYTQSEVPTVLAPLLYPQQSSPVNCCLRQESPLSSTLIKQFSALSDCSFMMQSDSQLADLVHELGPSHFSSLEECRNNLSPLAGRAAINATSVARLISSILQIHHQSRQASDQQIGLQSLSSSISLWVDSKDKNAAGGGSGGPGSRDLGGPNSNGGAGSSINSNTIYNMEVLMQAIMEIAPAPISCEEVMIKLDHKGFIVADAGALMMFVAATRTLSNSFAHTSQYPINVIYRKWQNADEQVLLLTTIISNPNIFCFVDFPCNAVRLDTLKTVPEPDSKDIGNWRSLNLYDLLFSLENSHYLPVKSMFMTGRNLCPDILMLGIMQNNHQTLSQLKQELVTMMVPIFLDPHPNTSAALNAAFYCTHNRSGIRQLVLMSMSEWYMVYENDQTRLSRILDVAHDIKALSFLLNVQPYHFVIDLACLAFRREYLKLDKWLNDKVRDHGEEFLTALAKFVQQRCPQLSAAAGGDGSSADAAIPVSKAPPLPQETLATITTCLNSWARSVVNPELTDTILSIRQNSALLSSSRPRPGNISTLETLSALAPSLSALSLSSVSGPVDGSPSAGSSVSASAAGLFAGHNALTAAAATALAAPPGSPSRGPLSLFNTAAATLQQQQQQLQTSLLSAAASAAQPSAAAQQQQQTSASNTLMMLQPGTQDFYNMFGLPSVTSKDVEDEANNFLHRIYSSHNQNSLHLAIKESLEQLKSLRSSTHKRDPEFHACVIRLLFDEYVYIPQRTLKEVYITGRLIGGIIDMGLVDCMALGHALRYVIEPLNKKPNQLNQNMVYFSIVALDTFKSRLKEYPQYSAFIKTSPFFSHFPAFLIEWVRHGCMGQEPASRPTGSVLPTDLEGFESSQTSSAAAAVASTAVASGMFSQLAGVNVFPNAQRLLSATALQSPSSMAKLGVAAASVANLTGTGGAAASSSPVTRSQSAVAASVSGAPGLKSTPSLKQLEEAAQPQPEIVAPSATQVEKIAFLFNNLSQLNLIQKSEELMEIVPDECWMWVAQYLVKKRVVMEANFHTLYANFMDHIKRPHFSKQVVSETLRSIEHILQNERTEAGNEKSTLKHLGHWLGVMTLAKNKPILHIEMDLKSLLIESYLKGSSEMHLVVPFAAKVMEGCSKSKIFKPPNPWTMSIVNLLVELHRQHDSKLYLKFEVEVLCNKLDLNADKCKITPILPDMTFTKLSRIQLGPANNYPGPSTAAAALPTDHMTEAMVAALGRSKRAESTPLLPTMPGFAAQSFLANVSVATSDVVGMSSSSLGQGSSSAGATPTPHTQPIPLTHTGPSPGVHNLHSVTSQGIIGHPSSGSATPASLIANEKQLLYSDLNITSIRGLEQHISINSISPLAEITNQAQLKSYVRLSLESIMQEMDLLVDVNLYRPALQTVETLVKKDFALDPDENQMRKAAHFMCCNMISALVISKYKEAIRTSIVRNMKLKLIALFGRNYNTEQEQQIEHFATLFALENLNAICAFIQKTCSEKSIRVIDERLAPEFELRKLSRSDNRSFYDHSLLSYQIDRIPEQLRVKLGRVSPQQMQIYKDFGRLIPGFAPANDLADPTPSALVHKGIAQADEYTNFFTITERLFFELEQTVQSITPINLETSPIASMLQGLYSLMLHARNSRDFTSISALLKKCVENLFEGSRLLVHDSEMSSLIKFRDFHLMILKAFAEQRVFGLPWTVRAITKCWGELRDEAKFTLVSLDWLMQSSLISLPLLDELVARVIEERNANAIYFAIHLIQNYILDENVNSFSESDIPQIFDALLRIARPGNDTVLLNVLEAVRIKHHDLSTVIAVSGDRVASSAVVAATAGPHNAMTVATPLTAAAQGSSTSANLSNVTSGAVAAAVAASQMQQQQHQQQQQSNALNVVFQVGVTFARDYNDPPGLTDKSEQLLREWISHYHLPQVPPGTSINTTFTQFIKQMTTCGVLKSDEMVTRFLRVCITYCREVCQRFYNEQQSNTGGQVPPGGQPPASSNVAIAVSKYRNQCYWHIDPFVRLVALLIRNSGDNNNHGTKANLLHRILGLFCGVLLHDIETSGENFFQLAYHRILIMLFIELNAPEPLLESINSAVLLAFTQSLHLLRPAKCPQFAYAWLEIVSHRVFLSRMLAISQPKGWTMYSMLITDLFQFLAPFLRNTELAPPLTKLYKGTLRVLLVLLHDFPEFLCELHFMFCDVIPPNCIQMRNLVLSAYPRNMRMPDPFTPNLKAEMVPEINENPKIMAGISGYINPPELRNNLDSYLKNRTPVTFLTELRGYLQTSSNNALGLSCAGQLNSEDGMRYNIQCMNALVLYVGMQAIAHIQSKGQTPSMSTIAHSAHMDIFQNLAVDLDTEGRYLFLNAIANQLRYPNSHTHYFSCTLLYLFVEANAAAIQEQITRVLLERLIVNRPHPWGLLTTFVELMKNPTYKFWSHDFVKCSPAIENLFDDMAALCLVQGASRAT